MLQKGGQHIIYDVQDSIKDYMVAVGMNEEFDHSFIHPSAFDKIGLAADDARRKAIDIMNPITDDFKVMRTTHLYLVCWQMLLTMLHAKTPR